MVVGAGHHYKRGGRREKKFGLYKVRSAVPAVPAVSELSETPTEETLTEKSE